MFFTGKQTISHESSPFIKFRKHVIRKELIIFFHTHKTDTGWFLLVGMTTNGHGHLIAAKSEEDANEMFNHLIDLFSKDGKDFVIDFESKTKLAAVK